MTVVAIRARQREHRDRSQTPSRRRQTAVADLTAKARAEALPLLDEDGALPVRRVDGTQVEQVPDDVAAMRTLRRARFALQALRAAGVQGQVDVRSGSGSTADRVVLALLCPSATERVRVLTHADRHGAPVEPSSGRALVMVGEQVKASGTVDLTDAPATVRTGLTAAVMDALSGALWREHLAAAGLGPGTCLLDVRPVEDSCPRVYDLTVGALDSHLTVRACMCKPTPALSIVGTLRWGQIVPARDADVCAVEAGLGLRGGDLCAALGPFVARLEAAAHARLGLPHIGAA